MCVLHVLTTGTGTDIENSDGDNDNKDCSPTTQQFIQESMAKGLPIITFNYSTEEIVQKRPNTNCFQTPGMNDPLRPLPQEEVLTLWMI